MHNLPIFVLLVVVTLSQSQRLTDNEMKTVTGMFCGQFLEKMVSDLCEGVYNTEKKRSMHDFNGPYREAFESLEYLDDSALTFPFRTKAKANSIIPVEFRKRQEMRKVGIADECCKKTCSLYEMKGYCL